MAGVRDIAKLANVSISTVSLVLNNNGYVSEETRRKVQDAMEALDYTPNELARNLSRNRSNIVGLIVPDIAHPFFAEFIKYAEAALYEKGYKTMVCCTRRDSNREQEYMDMLKRQIMDGVILAEQTLEQSQYKKVNRPIVALDRTVVDEIPIIRSDHKKGGELAAQKMLENGCKKVVQFSGIKTSQTPSHERHEVFQEILSKNGIEVITIESDIKNQSEKELEQTIAKVFGEHPDADGAFGSDLCALSCLKYVFHKKIRVPEDFKIIGYDGTHIAKRNMLSLTVIEQPIEDMAKASVELLRRLMEGEKAKQQEVVLDVKLVEGETTL